MTRTPTRSRAAWALLAVVALVVAGLRLASGATMSTDAAWTDDVHARTNVTLGTWTQGWGTCRALNATTGQPTGQTCTIANVVGRGVQDGANVGGRWQMIGVYLAPGTYLENVVYEVSIDLRLVGEMPANWVWPGAFTSSNSLATPPTGLRPACQSLPVATLYLYNWATNASSYSEFNVYEAGAASYNPTYCTK